jgi:hypothetical protein
MFRVTHSPERNEVDHEGVRRKSGRHGCRPGKIAQTDITDPRGHVERLTFYADHYIVTEAEAHEEFIRGAVSERSPRLVIIPCEEG